MLDALDEHNDSSVACLMRLDDVLGEPGDALVATLMIPDAGPLQFKPLLGQAGTHAALDVMEFNGDLPFDLAVLS